MKKPLPIKSAKLRNLLRGAISNTDGNIRRRTLDTARKIVSDGDIDSFSSMFVSEGLDKSIYGEPFPKSANEIFSIWRHVEPANIHLETTIQYFRLQKDQENVERAVRDVSVLNEHILRCDYSSAIAKVRNIVDAFGFSAAIIRKILYIYSQIERGSNAETRKDLQIELKRLLDSVFTHDKRLLLNLYTSYLLDLFDNRADLFQTISVQAKMNQQASISGKSRYQISMIQKARFPCFSETTRCRYSFYMFACSSLIDVFVEFCSLSFYDDPPRSVQRYFDDPAASVARKVLTNDCSFSVEALCASCEESIDTEVYKIASAIPENLSLNRFRAALDSQLVLREPTEIDGSLDRQSYFPPDLQIRDLAQEGTTRLQKIDHFRNEEADEVLRSFAVLFCLNAGRDFSLLDANEIRNLLGRTTGLSYTLTVDEVLQIRDRGDQIDSRIVSFLALIMLNERDSNDDREFELRMTFQKLLVDEYDGNILEFLDWIYERTPGLCDAVVGLCDIAFLERLYLIYSSYEDVLDQRQQLCRWAHKSLKNPNYLDLAEQLAVDAKVREIRGELDDTRIYVEEMRYKQWVVENITPLLHRYQRHVEILGPSKTDAVFSVDKKSESTFSNKAGIESDLHLYHALNMAFEEFCHNKTFGIDSYLSRRIRHGSLVGQLQAPVRSLMDSFLARNRSSLTNEQVEKLETVYQNYSRIIHELKDEKLQFKSDAKPAGLLSSDAFGTHARYVVFNVVRAQLPKLFESGMTASMLVEAFPSICWSLLELDLVNVRAEIVSTFRSRVRPLLRQVKSITSSNSIWISLQNDIDQKADESFREILRWFNRPERSSMSVSVAELAEVVKKEINGYHPESTIDYFTSGQPEGTVSGITYHTIYDIFYVLFDNAARYANPGIPLDIQARYITDDNGNSDIQISVGSRIRDIDSESAVRGAVTASLADDALPNAMIREGKSGLSKVRWLIENYPKPGRFRWSIKDKACVFEFSLPVVLVNNV